MEGADPIFIDKKTGGIWGCGTSLTNRIKDGTYIGEIENFKFEWQFFAK